MFDIHLEIVRCVVGDHVRTGSESIEPGQHLVNDLKLEPLDLVMVVLRLEDIAGAEFPIADLGHVTTVSDLVEVVRAWLTLPPSSDERETLPDLAERPARTRSAVQPIAAASVIPFGRPASFAPAAFRLPRMRATYGSCPDR